MGVEDVSNEVGLGTRRSLESFYDRREQELENCYANGANLLELRPCLIEPSARDYENRAIARI